MLAAALALHLLAPEVGTVPPKAAAATAPVPNRPTTSPDSLALQHRIIVGVPSNDTTLDREELSLVLAGHFAQTGLQFRVTPLSSDGPSNNRLLWASTYKKENDVLAVFWIEGHGDERSLYLFDPEHDQTWVRLLPPLTNPDELIESLGTMVRRISLSLKEGGSSVQVASMEKVEPPPDAPPPPPVTPRPSARPSEEPPEARIQWGLELTYAGSFLAKRTGWQSGGRVAFEIELPSHFAYRASIDGLTPVQISGPPVTTIWRIPINLGFAYRFRPQRKLRPSVDAGITLETIGWRGRSAADVIGRTGRTIRIGVTGGTGMRWTLVDGFGLTAYAHVNLWARNADLVVSQEGQSVPRVLPYTVTASIGLGVVYVF